MSFTAGSALGAEHETIAVSDDEDGELAFDRFAANAALDDFVVIEDDEDEYDRSPQPHSRLGIGDTVEIRTSQPTGAVKNGDFLRVFKIVENSFSRHISLRGLLFRRNRHLQPMLPRKLNEIYMMLTIDTEDPRPGHVQGLEEVALAKAFRKRKLKVTDLPYPTLSFRDTTFFHSGIANAKEFEQNIADHEVLVCRHVFAHIYGKGERDRTRRRPYQGLLRYVTREEGDEGDGIFTGKHAERITLPDDSEDEDDVLVEHNMPHGPNRLRRYTFGDGFQGGGGASCAAKLAGLKIAWGFDHDACAVTTASANFRRARIVRCEAADFPPPGFNAKCDILHLSPPCQAFSPANTNPNAQRDEINTNALFAIGKIIRAAEPRLVTLEETFGLLTREKHTQWFGTLLSLIYDEGYSVRWAIQNTLEYGVSQPRRRLALIAAAPGVPLPEMPKPTHGEPGSGLPSFVTVREAIGNIPRGTTNHNPMSARRIDNMPWDPDHPYNKTIMTSNSEVYHWSGRRKFTNRELAGLQGFPHTHTFHGSQTSIERQIGNAVPSTWFKLVFDECIKVLRRMDRAQGRSARSAHDDNEDGREETGLFGIPSRTMSPAPRNLSQTSKGSSAEDAIMIDGDEIIVID
ncbi:hypothetical protein SLS58_006337 [Diplodia intermedia]|uniref:DNA (cytosine-5-)-methyltransferase n=1 Tax=Diplodia intermedia TaxID=856260 RepID=A0ABR3TN76_9PEZI